MCLINPKLHVSAATDEQIQNTLWLFKCTSLSMVSLCYLYRAYIVSELAKEFVLVRVHRSNMC